MSDSVLITLNNGTRMPALGLGVMGREAPELVAPAVEKAIATGYRLIDTAASYGNERQVGEGLARSSIDRSAIFIATKLWLTQYGYDNALRGFDASLRRLGLEYVDLYLLHWPVPSNFQSTIDSYRAAERLLKEGRTRAIGVSKFQCCSLDEAARARRGHPCGKPDRAASLLCPADGATSPCKAGHRN
jgi:diketogulonate reductase-like aldo/keto reductase